MDLVFNKHLRSGCCAKFLRETIMTNNKWRDLALLAEEIVLATNLHKWYQSRNSNTWHSGVMLTADEPLSAGIEHPA